MPTEPTEIESIRWSGEVPAQKWMNFYTQVLTKLGVGDGMKLTVTVDYTHLRPRALSLRRRSQRFKPPYETWSDRQAGMTTGFS